VRAARQYGFDIVGVTRPDSIPQAAERLRHFLAEGAHGDMDWMETTAAQRGTPRALWPQVRSVIMLGLNYGHGAGSDPLAILKRRERGAISVYAQADDYHDVIKPRLKALAGKQQQGTLRFDIQGTGEETRSFCFVDDLVAGVRAHGTG